MASSGRQSNREEGNDKNHAVPGKESSKRRHGSLRQEDIRPKKNIIRGQTMPDIGLYLEPMLRKVLREELPPILQRHRHDIFPGCEQTLHHQPESSGSRNLRLWFTHRLPAKIYTHTRITSEDGATIGVVLCDARSQNCMDIVSEGPFSCSRVMMCALKGEFGSNGSEDWSEAEFNANISPGRDNKGNLLNGGIIITLENGVGSVPNMYFSDNSSWTRSRKFRLGAKAVENEARIREGRSEAFVVLDKRGQSYEKHDRPSLNDEIWRLTKIAKDGKIHKRLSLYNIKTVKDLLGLYVMNPPSLLKKIGKIAKKAQEKIIEHARCCEIDGERYIYDSITTAQQPIRLVFNSIYELVEVSFDGCNYRPLELLNSEEKRLVEIAKRDVYENVETSKYGSTKTSADEGQPSRSTSLCELMQEDEQEDADQMACGTWVNDGDGMDLDLISACGLELEKCPSPVLPPWELGNLYGPSLGPSSQFSLDPASASKGGKRKTVWNKIRHAFRLVIPFVAKRKANIILASYR